MKKIPLEEKIKSYIFRSSSYALAACLISDPCPQEGLVPCGTIGCPCQLCHLFVMFQRIYQFALMDIVFPLAVLMIVASGAMFYISGNNPGWRTRAISVLRTTVIGLVLIFSAYIVVNTFFTLIGVQEWTGLQTWFRFPGF